MQCLPRICGQYRPNHTPGTKSGIGACMRPARQSRDCLRGRPLRAIRTVGAPRATAGNARMLAHPSGSASPNLPSASLRRISRHFPQIRRHSIRRTWKTDYSSCRKVKISASAFIYRGQTHFVIRKMGKLQNSDPFGDGGDMVQYAVKVSAGRGEGGIRSAGRTVENFRE